MFIRYFVWLDFSFCFSVANIGDKSIQARENGFFFELQRTTPIPNCHTVTLSRGVLTSVTRDSVTVDF